MTKGLKIALIGLGVVAVGTTVGLILYKRKKDEEELQKLEEEEQIEELEELTSTETSGEVSTGKIIPKRDRNGAIVNPLSEVKGRLLYPAQDVVNKPVLGYKGAAGYATLRGTPAITSKYSLFINKINEYKGRTPIGTVITAVKDNLDPPMRWFKVKMKKPCCGIFTDYTEGYVRADVVTFNKYKKSSSFEGDMIERYAPDPLGANVFPHSNWMLPSGQCYSGMDGDDFELNEALTDLD